jgi:hypothetical protein
LSVKIVQPVNPKYVEAPPFAGREPFTLEVVHKLEREEEGDHS